MDMMIFGLIFGTIWGVSAVWNILSPKSREAPSAAWWEKVAAVLLIALIYIVWIFVWRRWSDPITQIVSVFVVALLFTSVQIGLQIYTGLRRKPPQDD